MARTHPHIDNPSEDQLRALVDDLPSELRELYLALHKLVVETLPDVSYSVDTADREIGYGARQYGYDGWGMAAVTPYAKWVSLTLVRATSLDDRAGLLEGTGSTIRHVKVRSMEQFDDIGGDLRELLEAATRVNEA